MLKFLLVVIILAVAVYALTRVMQRRGVTVPPQRAGGALPRRPKQPSGPIGPDDDEEFLRDLDRRRLGRDDPDS